MVTEIGGSLEKQGGIIQGVLLHCFPLLAVEVSSDRLEKGRLVQVSLFSFVLVRRKLWAASWKWTRSFGWGPIRPVLMELLWNDPVLGINIFKN